ncbi:hypothetical protein ACFSO7_21780 [Bacillus sp. CGMCC 1.16607]|uniref:hypothetical protein n=1 Tax=Bacillus sp. CGMCC 1.16607 TaxID=3351842 RepID=UPI003643E450
MHELEVLDKINTPTLVAMFIATLKLFYKIDMRQSKGIVEAYTILECLYHISTILKDRVDI